MKEHFNKEKTCAKYTKRHNAKKLEIAIESKTRVDASKLEYHLKTLTKSQKEEIIDNINKLEIYLGKKIECEKYKKININVLEKEG